MPRNPLTEQLKRKARLLAARTGFTVEQWLTAVNQDIEQACNTGARWMDQTASQTDKLLMVYWRSVEKYDQVAALPAPR